ncbi:unnamed protein product [Schistocephalus solidus]|uniref:ARL2_Bind_BART domain-containing protein n=1 Tax=Schistocephalus solidus TaxID=70667 RepID=A0A183SW55_SCHSO|nr:unnamed protein product [Schistocephalus solidus]
MDSPLRPFLANTFMDKIEQSYPKDTISYLDFYARYVDYLFGLTSRTIDIDELVQTFNKAHPSLQFSAETEANNETAFLDDLMHGSSTVDFDDVHRMLHGRVKQGR